MRDTVSYTVDSFLLTRRGEQEYTFCDLDIVPMCLHPVKFGVSVSIHTASLKICIEVTANIRSYSLGRKFACLQGGHGNASATFEFSPNFS